MSIKQNLEAIISTIPSNSTLIAVSKQQSMPSILEAYDSGIRLFGENRHKELVEKYNELPKDIIWHFIGSLQRSNVKYVVPIAALIHSVDSERLLETIDKEAAKCSKVMEVLFEVHVAREQSKMGWKEHELLEFLESGRYKALSNIKVRGVMAMASNIDDDSEIKREFGAVKELFDKIKNRCFAEESSFDTISAGMSNDYKVALECGANMVRIGSSIFK